MTSKIRLAVLAASLATALPALADATNGPDPYAAGYGFDTPDAAAWGGWTRGSSTSAYAEWDTFLDASYAGTRTAAADVGTANASDVYAGWNAGTFQAGSGNLYSFSVTEQFSFNLTNTTLAGPVRAVLQTEGWGIDIDLSTVTLNGVAATSSSLTFNDPAYSSSFGAVDLNHRLFVWDLVAAPTSYVFSFASDGHSMSLAQVAVDIGQVAAVPEPGTYALLLAGLGTVGLVARRRRPD